MARDKLDVKTQKRLRYSPVFDTQDLAEKDSQETWPGTRPKKYQIRVFFFFFQPKEIAQTNLGDMMIGATDPSIGDFLNPG